MTAILGQERFGALVADCPQVRGGGGGRWGRGGGAVAAVEPAGTHDGLAKTMVGFALVVVVVCAIGTWPQYHRALEAVRSALAGRVLLLLGLVLLTANVLALGWRIVLVRRYRPVPACGDEELPVCTVVVPAYNEGRQVLETLRSIVRSDYPAAKLVIIAVDDGSKDDTWAWIQLAAREHPGRIVAVRQRANGGKRRALYAGFLRSRGEVLVTIDSDSQVERETLRNLVGPFVRDAKVGAVAGNVRILNRAEGLIPRMLEVNFAYSFDFIRASQSMVDAVMCTPGALSAYRREVVLPLLPQWLSQRFCGRYATIGEDRAMTNMILRKGHHTRFQRNAVVYTSAPTGCRGLCKMFLRWARSNIRETLVMSGFVFGRFRSTPARGARVNLLLHWLAMTAGQVMKLAALVYLLWLPEVFGVRLLFGAALSATVPAGFYALRYRSSDALWAYAYSVFWVACLSWIGLYAWLTMHKNGWLTRDLPAGRRPAAVPELPPRRGMPAPKAA